MLEKVQESIVLCGVSDLVRNRRRRALLRGEVSVNVLGRNKPEQAYKESDKYEQQTVGHSSAL